MVLNKARDNRFGATAVFVRLAAAFWLILSAAGGAWALDGAVESADTSFLSVDLIDVALPDSRGVEPSPFILWRNNIAGQYLIRILSLQHATGRQLGTRLDIALPAGGAAGDSLVFGDARFSRARRRTLAIYHLSRFSSLCLPSIVRSGWDSDGGSVFYAANCGRSDARRICHLPCGNAG